MQTVLYSVWRTPACIQEGLWVVWLSWRWVHLQDWLQTCPRGVWTSGGCHWPGTFPQQVKARYSEVTLMLGHLKSPTSRLFNSLFRLTAKRTSMLHVTGRLWGKSNMVTSGLLSQRASNSQSVPIYMTSLWDTLGLWLPLFWWHTVGLIREIQITRIRLLFSVTCIS